MLLVATTALLVLAGTLAWIEKQLQDILRRLKEQEYTRLLPDEEKNKALPFYPQLWDAEMCIRDSPGTSQRHRYGD